jgi:hypothetical protein
VKDPNERFDYNEDPDLQVSWKCSNLLNGEDCMNSVGQVLTMNITEFLQEWGTKELAPYNSYNFMMNCTKSYRNLLVQAILIVVEMDLPLLTTIIPAALISRRISINEVLSMQIVPAEQQNPDDLRYSCTFIYNYD